MHVDYRELENRANELKNKQSVTGMEALTTNFSESASLLDLHEHLLKVDAFIAIDKKKVEQAEDFYHEIAQKLSDHLSFNGSDIDIHTQGSAKTRTLIKAPTRDLFDIDAICQIKSTQVKSQYPLEFFDQIGNTLKSAGFEVEGKKRCWRIKKVNSGYYIDLTPAIPATLGIGIQQFNYLEPYRDSAIFVVDCRLKSWKSSNPKGFSKWIEKQNEFSKSLIQMFAVCNGSESFSEGRVTASIEDVPEQSISHDEILLLAIRLFKRHRDIKVRDNLIDKDSKPISVIISTLLGQCVEAIVENKRTFRSLPLLLQDIAFKLPHLVAYDEKGQPVIPNPTAPDENFADRWPEENGKRKNTFVRWTRLLLEDINQLIQTNSKEKLDELFGTTQLSLIDSPLTSKDSIPVGLGLVDRKPITSSSIVPRDGLA